MIQCTMANLTEVQSPMVQCTVADCTEMSFRDLADWKLLTGRQLTSSKLNDGDSRWLSLYSCQVMQHYASVATHVSCSVDGPYVTRTNRATEAWIRLQLSGPVSRASSKRIPGVEASKPSCDGGKRSMTTAGGSKVDYVHVTLL
jgi:hypothetical protein